MDGITILNTVEYTVRGFGWTNSALIPIIAAIIFIALAFISWNLNYINLGDISFVSGLLMVIVACLICSNSKVTRTYNTYEVTIDDTVSWVEFNEKYKIVEQRGDIIVITEKVKE